MTTPTPMSTTTMTTSTSPAEHHHHITHQFHHVGPHVTQMGKGEEDTTDNEEQIVYLTAHQQYVTNETEQETGDDGQLVHVIEHDGP